MSETRPSFTTRKFLLRTALPVLATVIAICIAVSVLVVWSSRETDKIAVARQESLLALVVSQAQLLIAHDQESSTVWDDAVLHVKMVDNEEWLNSNLGSWMSTYFGHDGAYVLNSNDDPIFAFSDGKVAEISPLMMR